MKSVADYLIAQHVADPFRREARNVGVFVRMDGKISARFFAEDADGAIDSRKTKFLPFPSVYSQWVSYWRRTVMRQPERAWEDIKGTGRENYQIVDGGMVDRVGDGGIETVVNYLYAAIVSEEGIASALGAPDAGKAAVRLAEAVETELKKLNLMSKGDNLFVKHPVIRDMPVEGHTTFHTLTFFQRNGHDVIMEPIDLAVKRDKKRMEERAGWASRVFEDIKEKNQTTEAIAIVSATAAEEKEDSASYALKLIQPVATVVNWQSDEQRKKFIEDRRAAAA